MRDLKIIGYWALLYVTFGLVLVAGLVEVELVSTIIRYSFTHTVTLEDVVAMAIMVPPLAFAVMFGWFGWLRLFRRRPLWKKERA